MNNFIAYLYNRWTHAIAATSGITTSLIYGEIVRPVVVGCIIWLFSEGCRLIWRKFIMKKNIRDQELP